MSMLGVRRGLLRLWMVGSAIWIAYWSWYFYWQCDWGQVFTCVAPPSLYPAYFTILGVLQRLLAAPFLVLVVGLALDWAVRGFQKS